LIAQLCSPKLTIGLGPDGELASEALVMNDLVSYRADIGGRRLIVSRLVTSRVDWA
jgi:hypothetical protein